MTSYNPPGGLHPAKALAPVFLPSSFLASIELVVLSACRVDRVPGELTYQRRYVFTPLKPPLASVEMQCRPLQNSCVQYVASGRSCFFVSSIFVSLATYGLLGTCVVAVLLQ